MYKYVSMSVLVKSLDGTLIELELEGDVTSDRIKTALCKLDSEKYPLYHTIVTIVSNVQEIGDEKNEKNIEDEYYNYMVCVCVIPYDLDIITLKNKESYYYNTRMYKDLPSGIASIFYELDGLHDHQKLKFSIRVYNNDYHVRERLESFRSLWEYNTIIIAIDCNVSRFHQIIDSLFYYLDYEKKNTVQLPDNIKREVKRVCDVSCLNII